MGCPICGRSDKRACNPGSEAEACIRDVMFDQFGEARKPDTHWSDCAVHNEPALPAGPCNCGGSIMIDQNTLHADLCELLTVLGMGDHARPQSPHDVFQEALSVLRMRLAAPGASAPDAAARVCHEEQMVVWSGEVIEALSMIGFLREDWSYEDTIHANAAVAKCIRSIVESAFSHPELATLPAASAQGGGR